jgi:hypothetical protein
MDVTAGLALMNVLSRHLPGRSYVNENLSGQSACIQIQTRQLPTLAVLSQLNQCTIDIKAHMKLTTVHMNIWVANNVGGIFLFVY